MKKFLKKNIKNTLVLYEKTKVVTTIPMGKLVYFFILPGFPEYIKNMMMVANSFKGSELQPVFVICDRAIDHCIWGLGKTNKESICTECKLQSLSHLKETEYPVIYLKNFATKLDAETEKKITISKIEDLKYDGIDFPGMALIDLTLSLKIESYDHLTAEQDQVVRAYVRNCILIYMATKELFKKNAPDSIFYNGEYSPNLAMGIYCRKNNIPVFNVGSVSHKVVDARRSFLFKDLWEEALYKNFENWVDWKDTPSSELAVNEAYEDLVLRLKPGSQMVYSPELAFGHNIKEQYGVGDRKLVVAFTSSEDEAISTKKALEAFDVKLPTFDQPYESQMEWLIGIVEYFKTQPDYFLIIRIHPRVGKNKFDNFLSQHFLDLQKEFGTLHAENIKIIWPEESVSSYGLGLESDLALISWSNIGMEFARMGIPVLASMIRISTLPFDKFIIRVNNKEEYFKKMHHLLSRPIDIDEALDTLLRAIRWYDLSKFKTSVYLSDLPTNKIEKKDIYSQVPVEGHIVRDFVLKKKTLSQIYKEIENNKKHSVDVPLAEKVAHREGLKVLLIILLTGGYDATLSKDAILANLKIYEKYSSYSYVHVGKELAITNINIIRIIKLINYLQ